MVGIFKISFIILSAFQLYQFVGLFVSKKVSKKITIFCLINEFKLRLIRKCRLLAVFKSQIKSKKFLCLILLLNHFLTYLLTENLTNQQIDKQINKLEEFWNFSPQISCPLYHQYRREDYKQESAGAQFRKKGVSKQKGFSYIEIGDNLPPKTVILEKVSPTRVVGGESEAGILRFLGTSGCWLSLGRERGEKSSSIIISSCISCISSISIFLAWIISFIISTIRILQNSPPCRVLAWLATRCDLIDRYSAVLDGVEFAFKIGIHFSETQISTDTGIEGLVLSTGVWIVATDPELVEWFIEETLGQGRSPHFSLVSLPNLGHSFVKSGSIGHQPEKSGTLNDYLLADRLLNTVVLQFTVPEDRGLAGTPQTHCICPSSSYRLIAISHSTIDQRLLSIEIMDPLRVVFKSFLEVYELLGSHLLRACYLGPIFSEILINLMNKFQMSLKPKNESLSLDESLLNISQPLLSVLRGICLVTAVAIPRKSVSTES